MKRMKTRVLGVIVHILLGLLERCRHYGLLDLGYSATTRLIELQKQKRKKKKEEEESLRRVMNTLMLLRELRVEAQTCYTVFFEIMMLP